MKTRLRPSPRLAGALLSMVMRVVALTWRPQVEGSEALQGEEGRRLLLFWHGKYLPLFPLLAGRRACILTSPSYRGAVISALCDRFGYACRSLPHDVAEARRTLGRILADGTTATAADGPLGPPRRVKHALLEAAAAARTPILPVGVASRPRLLHHRRWDCMEIPLPFARIVVTFGPPLSPPPAEKRAGGMKGWACEVEEAMKAAEAQAESRVGIT